MAPGVSGTTFSPKRFFRGLHRIERLMRENALRARPRRHGLPKDGGERPVIMPNVLDRQFEAGRPNRSGWGRFYLPVDG